MGILPKYARVFSEVRLPKFTPYLTKLMRPMPANARMALIRSWSNGWFTLVRTHEPRIPYKCFFGCDANDDIAHYLCCDPLCTILCIHTGAKTRDLYHSAPARLCVLYHNLSDITRCVVAFQAYHALRNTHLAVIKEAQSVGEFEEVFEMSIQLIHDLLHENNFSQTPSPHGVQDHIAWEA